MGCGGKKKGKGGGGRVVALVALLAIGPFGCAATKANIEMLESPLVIGSVAVASQAECKAFAESKPKEADITRRVFAGIIPQFVACHDGLVEGLADPNSN